MSTKSFKDYGGYYINGVPYMDCKITGEPVRNVGIDCVSVISDRALMGRMSKMFPENIKKSKPKTGRPSGWHWMNEFVDKDGTVYHKGKEQPKLKGTLPPTKVTKAKVKTKRRTQEQILVAKYNEKQKLKKAFKKQQDFINHKVSKNK